MINPFRKKILIDPLHKEKESASRRGFIRKAIGGFFGATILARADELYSIESKTGYVYVKRNGEVINNYEPQGIEPYLGEINMYSFSLIPKFASPCDGSLLPIYGNSALFSLIWTIYGGDGSTTFALPDLRGRIPVHFGTGNELSAITLGQSAGAESVTLTVDQMPAHSHFFQAANYEAKQESPAGNYLAMSENQSSYASSYPNGQLNSAAITSTGGNASVPLMNPFVSIQFCIAMQGLFPSRC